MAITSLSVLVSHQSFLWIESALVLAAIAVSWKAPRLGECWFGWIERAFARLARRRALAVLFVAALPLALRLALLPVMGVPEPAVHDEFGYLLTAQTFASGRITEPPHPMWKHFESMNIIQHPSYASVYPVAQSLFLAAAESLGARPWFGVWLSVGLMCGAICWMLQAWFPPGWALLGSTLVALRFGAASYWMNSYWGGAPAALGGALALGAFVRLLRRVRVRDSLLLAAGLALLANSRPYEGVLLAIPMAAELAMWLRRAKWQPRILHRALLPIALVLVATASGMGYYNWRVTGNPARMPYEVSRLTYGFPIIFLWETPKPAPVYHDAQMLDYYRWMEELHAREDSPAGMAILLGAKVRTLWFFYVWPLFTVPLLFFPLLFRDRRMWFLLLVLGVSAVGWMSEGWMLPHYAAPVLGVFAALAVQCMRRLRLWKPRGRPAGWFLVRAIPVIAVAMLGLRAAAGPLHLPLTDWPTSWCTVNRLHSDRRKLVEDRLLRQDGRDLVLVRYRPNHLVHDEWVYNEADIDRARIVWARELDPASNAALLRYYRGRRVWLLEPDYDPPRLSPYPAAEAPLPLAAGSPSRPLPDVK